MRELLSRYFDTAKTLIGRYGGTVEKFIGDAVMAAWGTPAATEDDAERAVRAALDLVAAVEVLGHEVGAPELAARAGVMTGETAVTLGAEGEGMVAGDLVNTASRVQSAAEPGTVLVGEATRRASEAAIAYQAAGAHELKGKSEPVELWRALRVISERKGAHRSVGLEAPFVGRDRELRLVKDLFHASADERKAHLVSVTGIAGIGKSRLAWEFSKYIDGLADDVYWHRGRCLAYGEGVTYWALADMIRMRSRIAEDEPPDSALRKLRATLSEHLLDAGERSFVEPRLAQLLGLEEHRAADKADLFAAWRLFFERLADAFPTVLLFEDLQWADASLLDFVEYLLEWSRSSPLYVVTLARPELAERRPTWGAVCVQVVRRCQVWIEGQRALERALGAFTILRLVPRTLYLAITRSTRPRRAHAGAYPGSSSTARSYRSRTSSQCDESDAKRIAAQEQLVRLGAGRDVLLERALVVRRQRNLQRGDDGVGQRVLQLKQIVDRRLDGVRPQERALRHRDQLRRRRARPLPARSSDPVTTASTWACRATACRSGAAASPDVCPADRLDRTMTGLQARQRRRHRVGQAERQELRVGVGPQQSERAGRQARQRGRPFDQCAHLHRVGPRSRHAAPWQMPRRLETGLPGSLARAAKPPARSAPAPCRATAPAAVRTPRHAEYPPATGPQTPRARRASRR